MTTSRQHSHDANVSLVSIYVKLTQQGRAQKLLRRYPAWRSFRGWAMRRKTNLALAIALITAALPTFAKAQTHVSPSPTPSVRSPLLTTNRTFLASLNRISRGSSLWREAIEAVGQARRRVLVVTPEEVQITDASRERQRDGFDSGILAEAIPIVAENSQVRVVVVVVNLRLVRQAHDDRLSVPREFEADLDRVLVHEVYGHAVPYLLAGDMSGRCADPKKGENPSEACSIRRENAVRSELGLGRRDDGGLSSLTLAMKSR
jgi:hypothetical protein